MVEFECPECGKTFSGETDKEAYQKLKEHRKKEHFKDTKEEDLPYIS
mgnify:CR=1 FL=1